MSDTQQPRDPVSKHPRPEFPQQDQSHPGWTGPMDPPPDHGEESYEGHGLLTDRKALVTGGDSGIGRAVALAFAREGADVLFSYLEAEEEDARETVRLVEEAGRRAVAVACDIREEAQCRGQLHHGRDRQRHRRHPSALRRGINHPHGRVFHRSIRAHVYGPAPDVAELDADVKETHPCDDKESLMSESHTTTPKYTVPGMTTSQGSEVIQLLRTRLNALNELALTLKHVHWNVVGPHFIAVHQMLDPQVSAVREMADATAERISTLGGSPTGTPGALVAERTWDDYAIGRADAIEHLGALDLVFTGIISDHRKAVTATEEADPVSQDLLIEHLRSLELFQWFIRAHLENSRGSLSTSDQTSEAGAAQAAGRQARGA